MKLLSGPLSLFTGKVRIALDEKGLAYERVDVPFSRAHGYEPKHPEVLRYNPKAQVPVLIDGDLALYDSTLILEYLEERYPEPPLLPRDVVARARCRQAEAESDEVLFPHVFTLIRESFYAPTGGRDEAAIDGARSAIAAICARLDADLDEHEYMCGDTFTVADIAYFLTFTFARFLGASPDPELTRLGDWLVRVAERPSVRAEIDRLTMAAAA